MFTKIVECVPNFSEGRDPEVLHAILTAIRSVTGVLVLGDERDHDHHRAVITFAGAPEAAAEAAVRAAEVSTRLIDLRKHQGVHPRIGALDVLPFVPVQDITLRECADLARQVAERIWQQCGVPSYLYEAAALREDRRNLADIRRGNFEHLRTAVTIDETKRPDIGGPALHPTAGAVAVGARKYLIAWNVLLKTADPAAAKAIAAVIRQSSGGFPFVKALGLPLPSKGMSQVSMNLLDFEETPMQPVFDAIRDEATRLGVEVAGTELIGFIPRKALEENLCSSLRMLNFRSNRVLENRLEELIAQRVDGDSPAQITHGTDADALCAEAARLLGTAASLGARLVSTPLAPGASFTWEDARRVAETMRERGGDEQGLETNTSGERQNAAGNRDEDTTIARAIKVAECCVSMKALLWNEQMARAASEAPDATLAALNHITMGSLALAVAAGKAYLKEETTASKADFAQQIAALETLLREATRGS